MVGMKRLALRDRRRQLAPVWLRHEFRRSQAAGRRPRGEPRATVAIAACHDLRQIRNVRTDLTQKR